MHYFGNNDGVDLLKLALLLYLRGLKQFLRSEFVQFLGEDVSDYSI